MRIIGGSLLRGGVWFMRRLMVRTAARRHLIAHKLRRGDHIHHHEAGRLDADRNHDLAGHSGAGVDRCLMECEVILRWRSDVIVPKLGR